MDQNQSIAAGVASENPLLKEVLKPIIYADLFDYPLRFAEVYQFLEIETPEAVVQALLDQAVAEKVLVLVDDYYSLAHKSYLINSRQKRYCDAQTLWSPARRYGRWIASLPFVQMVAVTGSLAVDNPQDATDDIDYLIVTAPNRLWLCRALIILLVRYAHLSGVHLCPNYMLTSRVLQFEEKNLYTARELIQMVPLYGKETYHHIRNLNQAWILTYLPQSRKASTAQIEDELSFPQMVLKRLAQILLGSFLGDWVESVLQGYQINKHLKRTAQFRALDEVIFTPDICKGHIHGHNQQTMRAYQKALK